VADENNFRFSNEYHDNETNLIYYNYRYFNPETGKWLSRDPVSEKGGLNLYGFCLNNSIGYVDVLGNAVGVALPIAGTLAVDGPLPIGDVIGVGILSKRLKV
jgi:RHS repeat-associated protein